MEKIEETLADCKALLKGHFVLASASFIRIILQNKRKITLFG
jgi:hypothetical protein